MTMVNTVDSSDVLATGSLADGAIGNVLLSEQELIGMQDGRVHDGVEL